MNPEVKRLLEEANAKKAAAQALLNKGNELTSDDLTSIETLTKQAEDLQAKATQISSIAARLKGMEPAPAESDIPVPGAKVDGVLGSVPAGETYINRKTDGSVNIESFGFGHFSNSAKMLRLNENDYKEAYFNYILKGERRMSDSMFKTLQEGIDDQGGYLVPPEYVLQMITRKPTPTNVNPHVFKWTTGKDAVLWPKLKYTGSSTDDPNAVLYSTGVRVTYPGEAPTTDVADATEPAFGETRIDVHTIMMVMSMSRNMMEDSPLSVMALIESKFAETDALELDNRILNGTGVGQAHGILKSPSSGATGDEPQYVVSGSAATLTADGLEDLVFSLAPQYLGNAQFVMSWLSAAKTISKMKDGDGNYLWAQGSQDNRLANSFKDRPLLGSLPVYSEFMPAVAANAFPVIYGDLTGYTLVERLGLSIQVLHETKAKRNQVEIIARRRFGGAVTEPWKLKVQKCST